MSERLRASDLALLAEETPQTPMHNATLEIFDPADSGFDYDALLAHIDDRIAFVPRYRQHVRRIPGRLANPVWVDDEDFDLAYHVRRSALPRPGTLDQLRELTARIMSRRLDPDRPLWEVYFVEGLEDGRVAAALEVPPDPGRRHLDRRPRPGAARRRPRPAPAGPRRLGGRRPSRRRRSSRRARSPSRRATPRSPSSTAAQQRRGARPHRRAVPPPRSARSPASSPTGARRPESPFNVEPSAQRRVVLVRTSLKDYRKIRRVHGGTVNDVILATLSGAIRAWFMTRAESVGGRAAAAGAGADERDRRGARADLARLPGRRPPRRPADRRGVARRTPAPGVLRPARAQRDRPGRGRRPDRRRRRLRADHLPRARVAGGVQGGRAATSTW